MNVLSKEMFEHQERCNSARYLATYTGIFTDDVEAYDHNYNFLVEDLQQVENAYYDDLESGYVDEGEDAVEFLERHGIDFMG